MTCLEVAIYRKIESRKYLIIEINFKTPHKMKIIKLIIAAAFITLICYCKLYSDKVKQAQREIIRLEQIGYCKEWAHHKAFVEAGLIERDSLYDAIEED